VSSEYDCQLQNKGETLKTCRTHMSKVRKLLKYLQSSNTEGEWVSRTKRQQPEGRRKQRRRQIHLPSEVTQENGETSKHSLAAEDKAGRSQLSCDSQYHTEKGRLNESETQHVKEARKREIRTMALRRLINCTTEPLRQLNQYTAEPLRAEPLHCITEPAPHHGN
jgi:hypothetical protein